MACAIFALRGHRVGDQAILGANEVHDLEWGCEIDLRCSRVTLFRDAWVHDS